MVLNVRTITMVSIKLYTMLGSKDQTISILGQALSFYNNMAPIVALKISTFRTLSASTTWKTYHEVSRYIQETNGMYTLFLSCKCHDPTFQTTICSSYAVYSQIWLNLPDLLTFEPVHLCVHGE